MRTNDVSNDDLLLTLAALASPHRLQILAALVEGRKHVSELARAVRLSRPLVHAHLARLTAAGLVFSRMEVSADGKALRYVDINPFEIRLTPALVAKAVRKKNHDGEGRVR